MKIFSLISGAFLFVLFLSISGCDRNTAPFSVSENDQTIELKENKRSVLIYQKKPKTITGQYVCNNYIHPLYDLNGNILTEEFPEDHPYHRGVFWAWHQLFADGTRLGDGWTNDSIAQKVVKAEYHLNATEAQFNLNVHWYSSVLAEDAPFMDENTQITVHKLKSGIRKIDFKIELRSLVKELQIGGSADAKGYGGFCVRMRLPDDLMFTSENGQVIPQELQVTAGPWMDFSGRFRTGDKVSGLTILCPDKKGANNTQWILRQKGSMQNIVFPGRERIDIPSDMPVVLQYRLLIHKGGPGDLNIAELWKEYVDKISR